MSKTVVLKKLKVLRLVSRSKVNNITTLTKLGIYELVSLGRRKTIENINICMCMYTYKIQTIDIIKYTGGPTYFYSFC